MSTSAGSDGLIRPSAFVRVVMRPMVAMLNPLFRKMAGKRFISMAALLSHRGRRSGRQYMTPVGAHVVDGDCLVPLTFGSESDWSKNLRATGGGRLRWKGRDFDVSAPQVYHVEEVKSLVKKVFSAPERLGFKLLGIKGFLHLTAVPAQGESRPS